MFVDSVFEDFYCKKCNLEEHTRQNSQKHLTLTASLAVEIKEQLQQKLLEQDKKHKEEEEKLRQKIEEQEKKIEELAKRDNKHNEEEQKLKQKIEELEKKQERELDEQKLELVGQNQGSREIVDRLVEQQKSLQAQLSELSSQVELTRTFTMMGFTKAKSESSTWRSSNMYTYPGGYKFFFEIKANGYQLGRGKAVRVALWSTPGDFDSHLKWPVKVKITLELINQYGGDNIVAQRDGVSWRKAGVSTWITYFGNKNDSGFYHLISHSELGNYLLNDTLHFLVSTLVL